jgi:hypothetical protein
MHAGNVLVNSSGAGWPSSSLNRSRAELPARGRATRTRRSWRTVMAPVIEQAMVQGAERQPIGHLVRAAVRVPTDVCGIDPAKAIRQAQREAVDDAALGEVSLEHRGAEGHPAPADGYRVPSSRPTAFEDLLV